MTKLSPHSIDGSIFFFGIAMSNADCFRQKAENCLSLEAETVGLTDRKALLWMAEQWVQLARAADEGELTANTAAAVPGSTSR